MKKFLLVAVSLVLGACGDARQPIVDMAGRDPTQVNRDMAYCTVSTRDVPTFGNGITKCMKAKGYTIDKP